MCNNSPAESISPENGWRLSETPIPDRRGLDIYLQVPAGKEVVAVASKALCVRLAGAAASADLGGSSKYSSEILED